jgi:NodT family efflux transporter outer membrane factor (OMF) lipoprotein
MFSLLAGGCAVGPVYERPDVQAPAAWQASPTAAQADAWPDREWWKRFGVAELDRLIAIAHDNNRDLRAAAARVAQARANLQIAGAALYPTLTVAADAGRSKSGDARSSGSYALFPQASYEIDLWGLNRHSRDVGEAALQSSVYDQEVVRLTLTADVANAYFQILSLNDRLRVARENLANARRLLELIEAQKKAGRISGLELARQRSQVASTEASIPPLRQQQQVARDALALLLALHPGQLQIEANSLRPVATPVAIAGLPSQLLQRRPDVRRAEADLIAANANIGAARAALFPSLTLSAAGGWRSAVLPALFDSGKSFYSIGLDLLGTIFDGGRLSGGVDLASARKAELLEVYQQAILASFRDVEDALSGVEQFAAQEILQQEAATQAREAYRIAEIQYKAGAVDFTTVLDAQRTLLSTEAALDPVRLSRFTSLVALYRALGGGWEDHAPAFGSGATVPAQASAKRP